ncbi:hypothetical protein M8J75_012455 [Diaphorina citri]|nr:hypothetical protein M8J75_012455 [Diaphorina citri]
MNIRSRISFIEVLMILIGYTVHFFALIQSDDGWRKLYYVSCTKHITQHITTSTRHCSARKVCLLSSRN